MSHIEAADVDRIRRALDRERQESLVEERLTDTVIRRRSKSAPPLPQRAAPAAAPAPAPAAAKPSVSAPVALGARAPEPAPAAPPAAGEQPVAAPAPAPRVEVTPAPAPAASAAPAAPRLRPSRCSAAASSRRPASPRPSVRPPSRRRLPPSPHRRPSRRERAGGRASGRQRAAGAPRAAAGHAPHDHLAGGHRIGRDRRVHSAARHAASRRAGRAQDRDRGSRRGAAPPRPHRPHQPPARWPRSLRPSRHSVAPGQRPGAPPRKKVAAAGKKIKKTQITTPAEHKRVVRMGETIAVSDLAQKMGIKGKEVIKKLWALGMMGVNINQDVDLDTATLIATEFGYQIESTAFNEDEVIADAETPGHARGSGSARAGGHHHGPRRPRQDVAARRDPQGQRRRGRGGRHHPAHRRLQGARATGATSSSWTRPATRRSPPCARAARR